MKHPSAQSYHGLMATTYSLFYQTSPEEYNFYRYFLTLLPGPALELACGTGQLLLEYLREGFDVQGADSSPLMLETCALQGQRLNIHPKLYCQTIQDLDLPKQYMTIYIPSCAFMLVTDLHEALHALSYFYNHIVPGGQLVLSLFNPWVLCSSQPDLFKLQGDVITEDKKRILLYQAFNYHYIKQLRHGRYRFEIYAQEHLQTVELHDLWWRWYGIYEFEGMLKQAGFSNISLFSDFTLEQPTNITDTLIFRAQKGRL